MKHIFVLSIIMVNISLKAQEYISIDKINFEFYYIYSFWEDSTSNNSQKAQITVLQIGEKSSKFVSTANIYKDSLLKDREDLSITEGLSSTLNLIVRNPTNKFADFYIYKNYPEKGMISFYSMVSKKNYLIQEQLKFNWLLDNSSQDTILGLVCKKAITKFRGRNYVAWYCDKIPINDGPYKFFGLPGLILKVQDEKNSHRFEITKIVDYKKNTLKPDLIFVKKNYIQVTPNEFVKVMNNYSQELYQMALGLNYNSEERKARALARIKSINNFIEK